MKNQTLRNGGFHFFGQRTLYWGTLREGIGNGEIGRILQAVCLRNRSEERASSKHMRTWTIL